MKTLKLAIGLLSFVFFLTLNGFAANPNCFDPVTGINRLKINGIYHTSCFDWQASDGKLLNNTKNNDTGRLQRAITAAIGKLVFDEAAYFINDYLTVPSYRTLIGTGRAVVANINDTDYPSSRIVQTASNKGVFKIGGGTNSVAIRDLTLQTYFAESQQGNTSVGILAENGNNDAASQPSTNFEFTNLTIDGFDKGIYVNAKSYTSNLPPEQGFGLEGFWRFDNVKLDHVAFHNCRIGVHVNSSNSGWNAKNVLLYLPGGAQIPAGGITASNVGDFSLGFYLQRITYSTFSSIIGDGPTNPPGATASALFYVGQHGNLTIENSVDEVFKNSIYIFGGDTNSPVNLSNNFFQSPLKVRYSHVVSTANFFNTAPDAVVPGAEATLGSRIFSIGDKFCFEQGNQMCQDMTYKTDGTSEVVFSTYQHRTTMSALRIGAFPYQYDITRNVLNGILEFKAAQGTPNGGNEAQGYAGYRFSTHGGTVLINYDGSVTYGSKNHADLNAFTNLLGPSPNGTVIFCSDCQKTTPCSPNGSGALAKRINMSWDCN